MRYPRKGSRYIKCKFCGADNFFFPEKTYNVCWRCRRVLSEGSARPWAVFR